MCLRHPPPAPARNQTATRPQPDRPNHTRSPIPSLNHHHPPASVEHPYPQPHPACAGGRPRRSAAARHRRLPPRHGRLLPLGRPHRPPGRDAQAGRGSAERPVCVVHARVTRDDGIAARRPSQQPAGARLLLLAAVPFNTAAVITLLPHSRLRGATTPCTATHTPRTPSAQRRTECSSECLGAGGAYIGQRQGAASQGKECFHLRREDVLQYFVTPPSSPLPHRCVACP
jgi:hypothetical protein